jgi:hypothetical protein
MDVYCVSPPNQQYGRCCDHEPSGLAMDMQGVPPFTISNVNMQGLFQSFACSLDM